MKKYIPFIVLILIIIPAFAFFIKHRQKQSLMPKQSLAQNQHPEKVQEIQNPKLQPSLTPNIKNTEPISPQKIVQKFPHQKKSQALALSVGFPSKPHYQFIHIAQLRERLKQGQKIVIVDVRDPYAYLMQHIPGAVNIPLGEVKSEVTANPLPKTGMVVTYCSCPRHEAELASDILKGMGYHNIFVLYGGLPGWVKDGYRTVGELAGEPVHVYWVIGHVYNGKNQPKRGVVVRIFQPQTQQLEIGKTDKNGFYAISLRFYGLMPGSQLQAFLGSDVIYFSAGAETKPWGTLINDDDGRVKVLARQFLPTFRKYHL